MAADCIPTNQESSPISNCLIAPQHALDEIAQWPPEVLAPVCQPMFIDEEYIVFEACVEVRLKTELDDDGVVMAVDVCIDTVQALEHVANEGWEGLREWNTDTAGEHLLIVDIRLHPRHQVFNILGCGHLSRSLVVLAVLPQVLEPGGCQQIVTSKRSPSYSSVAFISGQLCGEQNSVIDP